MLRRKRAAISSTPVTGSISRRFETRAASGVAGGRNADGSSAFAEDGQVAEGFIKSLRGIRAFRDWCGDTRES
jgi:hypothetical protein